MSDIPIRRLAIVNRGEAAMRCIRTVKALRALEGSDMEVVALYTDVDREAPFVRHADHAIRLSPRATPVASYLDHDLLISTLRKVGAYAVWPGWGFVAESPEFVDRLQAAGIRFLGPTGDTMRRLGDKIASKELAERVGVPVTAWSGGVLRDLAHASAHFDVAVRIVGVDHGQRDAWIAADVLVLLSSHGGVHPDLVVLKVDPHRCGLGCSDLP